MEACTIASNPAALADPLFKQDRVLDAPHVRRVLDTNFLHSLQYPITVTAVLEHLGNKTESAALSVHIQRRKNLFPRLHLHPFARLKVQHFLG